MTRPTRSRKIVRRSGKGIAAQEKMRMEGITHLFRPILLLCIGLILLPQELLAAKRHAVSHVVIVWLKRPGNAQDQQQLIRASESFRKIRGVIRVEAGVGMPVTRPGVEQEFDVGVAIVFRDRAALQSYEKDPRHLRALRETMKPLAKRYLVYNFSSE